jgi:hypothetical protein
VLEPLGLYDGFRRLDQVLELGLEGVVFVA